LGNPFIGLYRRPQMPVLPVKHCWPQGFSGTSLLSMGLPAVPKRNRLASAKSGIFTRADVERLKQCGSDAILVGESLMRGDDVATQVRALISSK
jgi:hypothetical protein